MRMLLRQLVIVNRLLTSYLGCIQQIILLVLLIHFILHFII